MDEAFIAARSPHRGPAFVDVPMDEFFNSSSGPAPGSRPSAAGSSPTATPLTRIAGLLAQAPAPVLILGTDVWADGAEEAALRFVEDLGIPTLTNGMGRGVVPGGHPLLVTKARERRARRAPTWSSWSARRSTSGSATASSAARRGHDARPGRARRRLARPGRQPRRARRLGVRRPHRRLRRPAGGASSAAAQAGLVGVGADLPTRVAAAAARDAELLGAEADPIHPARIYGELVPRLADDAVVIGDGGDFVSFAGKYVEPKRPGGWLDPGPYGCLGAGLGCGDRGPARAARRRRSCCCSATARPASR